MLAFDIGGPNSIAALISDGRIVDRRRVLTRRGAGSGAWLDAASEAATAWRGRFRRAVMVEADHVGTPDLAIGLAHRMGFPVTSLPEAQAAAWSEHRFGKSPGGELVFLLAGWSVSGAIVTNGALLRGAHGLAAQLGRIRVEGGSATVAEAAGGATLLRRGAQYGARDLEGVLSSASAGARWAALLLEDAATALASAVAAVQRVLDPAVIVVGGVVGAAPGFVDRLQGRLAEVTPRPVLRAASGGTVASLIGAADHAARQAGILALPAG